MAVGQFAFLTDDCFWFCSRPKFGKVKELTKEEFVEAIDSECAMVTVIIHVYEKVDRIYFTQCVNFPTLFLNYLRANIFIMGMPWTMPLFVLSIVPGSASPEPG